MTLLVGSAFVTGVRVGMGGRPCVQVVTVGDAVAVGIGVERIGALEVLAPRGQTIAIGVIEEAVIRREPPRP